jgi:hypothetical protein
MALRLLCPPVLLEPQRAREDHMNEMHAAQAVDPVRTWKAVYTIVERPGSEKKYWVRIGTAFLNRDQSLNVKLDGLPINGQLHIRDAEPYNPARRGSGANGAEAGFSV